MNNNYEDPNNEFTGNYTVSGYEGIAFYILGYETVPDEDTEWSGYEVRTGDLVGVMVGDDLHHSIDPSDITAINEDEFCTCCGQVGCQWG
jgi:hypothetical protein